MSEKVANDSITEAMTQAATTTNGQTSKSNNKSMFDYQK